ncbi:MAG TPA: DinB family protein [Gemmatimonadales bacterium]|nr:DinB family protein [Gemmatimonadales bacterium]
MPLAQLLLPEFDAEMASTRRLLECVPDGKATWQPHERSMTLGRLATHVAELAGRATAVVAQDEWDPRPPGANVQPRVLDSRAKLLQLFDEGSAQARVALAKTSDADFGKSWTMKREGKPVYTGARLDAYRRIAMNHMIHHRAQLGVYLRLLGVPIPGMYGPSADDLAKMK